MKNESINQAQIAQKAVFDFDPDSSGSTDYQNLALEFLQLYHRRTGVPMEEKLLTTSIMANLNFETELINP
jgi:nitrogenase subunit NifH